MFLEICMQIHFVVFALSRQINKEKYAKTINLLWAGNKIFVTYQTHGRFNLIPLGTPLCSIHGESLLGLERWPQPPLQEGAPSTSHWNAWKINLLISESVSYIGVGAGKFSGCEGFLPKFSQTCPKNSPNKVTCEKMTAFHCILGLFYSNRSTSSTIFAQISPNLPE